MSNGNEHTDDGARTDELLMQLIRTATRQTSRDFTWPEDAAILAYLQGKANEAQHNTVQEAIVQSSEFRRFLIDTGDQLAAVTSDAAIRAFDAVPVPPDLSSENQPPLSRRPRWLDAILRPRVLAPVAVGAVAVLIALTFDMLSVVEQRPTMFAAYSELERSEFVTLSTRSAQPEDSVPRTFATAYDAAMDRLRASIAYDLTAGGFQLSDGAAPSMSPALERRLVLRFLDEQENEIGRITTPVLAAGTQSAEAWIVAPPALTLWHVSLPGDSLDITWPAERPARGCVTFTERRDSGYIATPGHIFQL